MTDVASVPSTLDCVHCGLCLPACPTYDVLGLETDSPRGRIYLMRAIAEGRIADPASVRQHLDQCLGCRACETACPSGVRYGAILEQVRAELEQRAPAPGRGARIRRFLLKHVVAHQGRLRFAFHVAATLQRLKLDALASRLHLLPAGMRLIRPRIPGARRRRPLRGSFAAIGEARGRVALLTGCVMEPLFGDVHRATVDVLRHNGFTVDIPGQQVCCGALLLHDGQADAARALAARNVAAFADADVVVTNSAGCGATMKDYGHLLDTDAARAFAAKCKDVTEVLADAGLRATPSPFPHKVAYDDPCHLCHGQGVRQPPRTLLAQVPGLELVPHQDPESCCGSAGIYNLVQPTLAAEIGQKKAAALIASGAEVVVTGNPGCAMQIAAHLRAQGHPLPVRHPIELLRPESRS